VRNRDIAVTQGLGLARYPWLRDRYFLELLVDQPAAHISWGTAPAHRLASRPAASLPGHLTF